MKLPEKLKRRTDLLMSQYEDRRKVFEISDKLKRYIDSKATSPTHISKKLVTKERPRGRRKKYTTSMLIRVLKSEAKKLSRPPSAKHFYNDRSLPSAGVYVDRFGSWNAALQEAGLNPNVQFLKTRKKGEKTTIEMERIPENYSGKKSTVEKLALVHLRAPKIYKGDKSLREGLMILDRIANEFNTPENVTNRAREIYEKSRNEGLVMGWSMKEVAAAVLIVAYREQGMPITLAGVSNLIRCPRHKIARILKKICKKLNILTSPPDAENLISPLCQKLNLSSDIALLAKNITSYFKKSKNTSGKNPLSIATSSLYIAAILNSAHLTQEDLCREACISTVSLRNVYKEIVRTLGYKDLDDLILSVVRGKNLKIKTKIRERTKNC